MKLLIADDHTLFRDALVQYIERAEAGAYVKVTKDFYGAYDVLASGEAFDLVLLDLRMPGMHEMEGFRRVRDDFPDTKVALMSGVAEPDDVKAAMDLGAVGYFPKTLSGKAIVKAVQKVMEGETFVPHDTEDKIMPSYYIDTKRVNVSTNGVNHVDLSVNPSNNKGYGFNLTPREKEVLTFLERGDSNKEIANTLGLQVVTVKLHVRGICRKLDTANRTQAALKATQLGLVESAAIGANLEQL